MSKIPTIVIAQVSSLQFKMSPTKHLYALVESAEQAVGKQNSRKWVTHRLSASAQADVNPEVAWFACMQTLAEKAAEALSHMVSHVTEQIIAEDFFMQVDCRVAWPCDGHTVHLDGIPIADPVGAPTAEGWQLGWFLNTTFEEYVEIRHTFPSILSED